MDDKNVNLIIGAGAVGTILASYLMQAGRRTAFLMREKDLAAWRAEHELRVERVGKGTMATPAPELHTQLDLADVRNVLICVKHPALQGVIASLPRPLPSHVRLITTLNGVGIAEQLRAAFPQSDVVTMTIMFNGQLLGPMHGQISTKPIIYVASRDRDLLGLFDGSGMKTKRAEGEAAAWGKLLINLNNSICALTRCTFKDMLTRKDMTAVYVMLLDEAVGVLERAGIPYTLPIAVPYRQYRAVMLHGGPIPWWIAKVKNGVTAESFPSMVADVERGRTTEIDQLNGEIVRLGERIGVPTLVNSKVVELVLAMQGRMPPDFISPAELRRILRRISPPAAV